jgi:hypothetical protein
MLRGAVTFGEDFKENYLKQIFDLEKGMTQAISHYSRYGDADVVRGSKPYRYTGQSRKIAAKKVGVFYAVSITTLGLLAVLLFILTAHFGEQRPVPAIPITLVPAVIAPPSATQTPDQNATGVPNAK